MSILNDLPELLFANKDTAQIETEVIEYFEKQIGRKIYPGDPLRLLLLSFIKYLSLQRSLIDFSAKQNLLKYATDGYIDNIGALVGTYRLNPTSAVTTLRFELAMPLETTYIIKKGTRATAGDEVYFATDEAVEIIPGEMAVEVMAHCTETGAIGNGYYPGQINVLADPFPYAMKVQNITRSQNGADEENTESLRERIRLAPESFSTAGPYGAYEFWAKTASQNIIDISVTSPNPGKVEIVPLLANGEIPTQSLMDQIFEVCNDEKRRPLTDCVKIRPPEEVFFDIEFVYFISRKNASEALKISQQVEKAITQYVHWQKTALGRDLNPSKLIQFVMDAGAKRVEVKKPEFLVLKHYEIAVAKEISIVYGGIEDA